MSIEMDPEEFMLRPDDINVGDWISIREAPETNFDSLRGRALLVKSVDLPFIVTRFYTPPADRTNVILDTRLCKLMRLTDHYVFSQMTSDLNLIANAERQADIYQAAHFRALEQQKLIANKPTPLPDSDS